MIAVSEKQQNVSPPGLVEILLFPLLGTLMIDLWLDGHPRAELPLLFIPVIWTVIRLWRTAQHRDRLLQGEGVAASRVCFAAGLDQLAVLPLMLFEAFCVVAASRGGPPAAVGLALCGVPFALYVVMRLIGRAVWSRVIIAAC